MSRTSILIVNFQAYGALARCLASIRRHAPEAAVIVVDHASDPGRLAGALGDGSAQVLPDPRNPGFAAGVNRAAATATREYLLLLNPDCELEGAVPRRLAEWLDAHPGHAVAGPRVLDGDGRVQASARRFPDWTTGLGGRTSALSRWWPDNALSRRNLLHGGGEPVDVDWVSGACLMVRRQAFVQVGGLDERFFLYWEDADLCRRLRDRGWRTAYCPLADVRHAGGASSRADRIRSLRAFHQSALRYHWKHATWPGRAMTPLVALALAGRFATRLLSMVPREDRTTEPQAGGTAVRQEDRTPVRPSPEPPEPTGGKSTRG